MIYLTSDYPIETVCVKLRNRKAGVDRERPFYTNLSYSTKILSFVAMMCTVISGPFHLKTSFVAFSMLQEEITFSPVLFLNGL